MFSRNFVGIFWFSTISCFLTGRSPSLGGELDCGPDGVVGFCGDPHAVKV